MKRLVPAIAALILSSAVPAGAAADSPRTVTVGGAAYIDAAWIARQTGMSLRTGSSVVMSGRNAKSLVFTPGKRSLSAQGMRLDLAFPTLLKNNRFLISRTDWEKCLKVLLFPDRVLKRRAIRRIVIDCGHGGRDSGASGLFSKEKNIVLKLGMRTAEILRVCGYQVVMSRTDDRYIPLAERGFIQRRRRGDLFISIHANAIADRGISGIECYILPPTGTPSSNSGNRRFPGYRGNATDENNLSLALNVQRALLRRTRAFDMGIKRARFAVLRDIDCPGLLIEVGFISNRREEKRLNDPAYREKLARGIAEGVISYHRATRLR